jgi:hypothetical protein
VRERLYLAKPLTVQIAGIEPTKPCERIDVGNRQFAALENEPPPCNLELAASQVLRNGRDFRSFMSPALVARFLTASCERPSTLAMSGMVWPPTSMTAIRAKSILDQCAR